MKIKGIKYIAPVFDGSGYAKAARGNIMALRKLGVPLTLEPVSFEAVRPPLGEIGEMLLGLVKKDIDYNIVFIHTTPEFWKKHREEGKTNVGYTIWETTKLHPDWSGYINNNVEKVMVGCTWNVNVFKESGVTIPIGVVPHGIDSSIYEYTEPYKIIGVEDGTFMFYDVFQWTERKHPIGIIKAYWHAFQNNENVALVLKTYRSDYSDDEKKAVRLTIQRLKEVTPMEVYPKICYILDMLSDDEINGLHVRGDCLVSLNRGEGFGLSPFSAGAAGNPVIVTGFGGVTEYVKPENGYLIDYQLTPVWGMPWSPWYRGDQLWAEPNVLHASALMKHVYENQGEARLVGSRLKDNIINNFTWKHIGQKIIKEIEVM